MIEQATSICRNEDATARSWPMDASGPLQHLLDGGDAREFNNVSGPDQGHRRQHRHRLQLALGKQARAVTNDKDSKGYKYDGADRRTAKTVNSGPADAFTYDLDGLPLVIADGTPRYVTGPGGLPLDR
jgi:YD repeat-containing protein